MSDLDHATCAARTAELAQIGVGNVSDLTPTSEHAVQVTRRSWHNPTLDVHVERWTFEEGTWHLDACPEP